MAKGAPDYSNVAGYGISVVLYGLYQGEYKEIAIDDSGAINTVASPHAANHQDGGSDEINVTGLSGRLADFQSADRVKTGLDADKPATGNTEGDVWWSTDIDKLYIWDGSAWKEVGAGIGDMLKSVYDTDDDGVVDNAEALDSLTWDDNEALFRLFRNRWLQLWTPISLDFMTVATGGTGTQLKYWPVIIIKTGSSGGSYSEMRETSRYSFPSDGDRYAFCARPMSDAGFGTFFAGLADPYPSNIPLTSLTYTQKHVGLLGRDDNWYCSVGDGTNQTKVAITGRPQGWFSFVFTATPSVKFYSNGTFLTEITTNIPTSVMRWCIYVHNSPYATNNRWVLWAILGMTTWTV